MHVSVNSHQQESQATNTPGRPANPESTVAHSPLSFFSDDNMPAIMNGACPDGFDAEDKTVARQMKSLSRTAPIALSDGERLDRCNSLNFLGRWLANGT